MAFRASYSLFLSLLLSSGFLNPVQTEPTADKQALLNFISQVPHKSRRLVWDSSDSVCNWVGITCDTNESRVTSLRLPGVGLVGQIPANTIGLLTELRVISIRSNLLFGEIPADFSNLRALRNLYLQNNLLDGEFPQTLTKLTRLTRLDLSNNNFTGKIPFSINNLSRLTGLFLQNNSFYGNLPSINVQNLENFNVSYNNLNGSIPKTLERFNRDSFLGNLNLCDGPLAPCNPFFPSLSPSPSSTLVPNLKESNHKLSRAVIIAISVVCAAFLILLCLILLLFLRARRKKAASPKTRTRTIVADTGTSSSKDELGGTGIKTEQRNKLVFFSGGTYNFDLEDLLKASAEVLGKGSMGTSYKAILEDGTTVVVKRLKDIGASKKEFESQMEILGKIDHVNSVPVRAFYYSKDEKLLVSDFMAAGSLSSLLHGSRGPGRTPLNWDHRIKIAIAAGQGIAHLHNSAKVVHGNIKASNVLLRANFDACVSDYGLNALFSANAPSNRVVAGYRAPEMIETRKATFKSDVYSFGVVLLELLTGKSPNQASLGEEGIDLPRWVQSVVREEWTGEVFDTELMRYDNIEEEMVQLLQISMACVSTLPDQRPTIEEVVRMIEDIRMENNGGQRFSSADSIGLTPRD